MIIFVFLFGLCVGSFVFAFYERFCAKKPIFQARSFCFSCKKRLKFYHLIPLFSYIFLRGKCGFCGAKISFLSPFCEFFCGFLFVFAFLITLNAEFNALNTEFTPFFSLLNVNNLTLNFVFLALFLSTVLLLSLIDLKLKAVPETLLWVAFIFAFCFAVDLKDIYGFLFWGGIDGFVLNAPLFAGFVFLLKSLVSCVLNIKRQNEKLESMGEADILIIASMGGILGLTKGFCVIFLAAIFALFAFMILKLKEKFTPNFATENSQKIHGNLQHFTNNFSKNSRNFISNFSKNSQPNSAQNHSENSVSFKQKNDSDFKEKTKIYANFKNQTHLSANSNEKSVNLNEKFTDSNPSLNHKNQNTKTELPFIPFLSAAFLVILAFKDIL